MNDLLLTFCFLQEIREKVKVLLQEASTLITKTYFHSEGVKEWAQSIDRRYKDFACFMKKYRQSLEIKLGCSIPELEVSVLFIVCRNDEGSS